MKQVAQLESWLTAVVVPSAMCLAASGVSFAQTSGCQSTWIPTFGGIPGFEQPALFLKPWDDGSGTALYAGGYFNVAFGQHVSHVAKWNGASWSALGTGLNGAPSAAEEFDDGTGPKLYVGGAFSNASGVAANGIAAWNGTTWSALGAGVNSTVLDLAVYDDGQGAGRALYACGYFSQAGGISASSIAKWNGVAWSKVSTTTFNGLVARSLAVYDDGSGLALYAGGYFTTAGGVPASHIARWNGTAWSAVGTGIDDVVNDLLVYDDGAGPALYACGEFGVAGGASANRIAKWDGAAWSSLGAGLNGAASNMTVYDDGSGASLCVAGDFTSPAQYIAKWNGAAWSALPTEVNDTATALGVFDDGSGAKLYASGYFSRAGGVTVENAAVWDGAAWSSIAPSGVAQPVNALESFDDGSGEALYVSGPFATIGGVPHKRVARWDGSNWTALGAGFSNGVVYDFEAFDEGHGNGEQLFAGGGITASGGLPTNHIAKWDGANWSEVGGGVSHVVFSLCLFDDGGGSALYAGGSFTSAGSVLASKVARWDGTSWSALGGGIGNGTVFALVVFDDGSGPALYAGGTFQSSSFTTIHSVRRWNGSSWSNVGFGLLGGVRRLAVFDNADGFGLSLFAALEHSPYVVRWNGTSWVQVGTNLIGTTYALRAYDDGGGPKLYAGTGSGASGNVYRLEGAMWASLGAGMNAEVSELGEYDDGTGPALFAGGAFTSAFESGDSHLARWRCAYSSHVRSYCTAGTTSNGCVPAIAGLGVPSAGAIPGFTISIASVEGAKTGLLFYGVAGQAALPWGASSTSLLCVQPPTQRMGTLASGGTSGACDGVLTQDWSAYIASHPGAYAQPFYAGDTVWAQGWFRDPPAPKTTNLSDALEFTLVP